MNINAKNVDTGLKNYAATDRKIFLALFAGALKPAG